MLITWQLPDCSFPVVASKVDIDHSDYKQSFSTLPTRCAVSLY